MKEHWRQPCTERLPNILDSATQFRQKPNSLMHSRSSEKAVGFVASTRAVIRCFDRTRLERGAEELVVTQAFGWLSDRLAPKPPKSREGA
jgi:hypothetical protein